MNFNHSMFQMQMTLSRVSCTQNPHLSLVQSDERESQLYKLEMNILYNRQTENVYRVLHFALLFYVQSKQKTTRIHNILFVNLENQHFFHTKDVSPHSKSKQTFKTSAVQQSFYTIHTSPLSSGSFDKSSLGLDCSV